MCRTDHWYRYIRWQHHLKKTYSYLVFLSPFSKNLSSCSLVSQISKAMLPSAHDRLAQWKGKKINVSRFHPRTVFSLCHHWRLEADKRPKLKVRRFAEYLQVCLYHPSARALRDGIPPMRATPTRIPQSILAGGGDYDYWDIGVRKIGKGVTMVMRKVVSLAVICGYSGRGLGFLRSGINESDTIIRTGGVQSERNVEASSGFLSICYSISLYFQSLDHFVSYCFSIFFPICCTCFPFLTFFLLFCL